MAYTFKTYLYNEKLTKEQNLIMDKLYKLRMSGMADALEQQLLDPNSRLDSFEDRFSDIVTSFIIYFKNGINIIPRTNTTIATIL